MRKAYIDNLRWSTVILVLVYHVFYIFNGVGVLGGVGGFTKVQYQDSLLYFVYPWFMVLLFLLSGMSSRYALMHRTNKQFIKERTVKLLVPSTLGLFVFQWMTGYFNIKIGGGWDMIPPAVRYPVMVLAGTGPLWFIQMLWLFSLLLILIRKIDSGDKMYVRCGKCKTGTVLLLFLPIWGAAQIGNMPVVTTYRFGIYFMAFLLGYFVFSHEEVEEKVQRMHLPMLVIFIVMGIGYTIYYFGQNYAADVCLKSLFTNIYLWAAVLAILGCAGTWMNRTSKMTIYMTESSFGIYIVHYIVVLSVCYCLKFYTALPVAVIYLVAVFAVLILSPVLYEIIRHIPVLRYLVLGIRKKKCTQL